MSFAKSWTRPELNVKSEKFIGPFQLSPNELDAYGEAGPLFESKDLRPFFLVLRSGEDFEVAISSQIREWIELNVPVRLDPIASSNPGAVSR